MDSQNKQSDLKIVIGILLVAILALAAIFYFNNREVRNELDKLANERELILTELEDMQRSFTALSRENEQYSKEIQRLEERIEVLLDSISRIKVAANQMFAYKNQVIALKKENKMLRDLVDSLKKNNTLFKQEIGVAQSTIENLADSVVVLSDKLQEEERLEKQKQQQLLKEASVLELTQLNGTAFKLRANGNIIETSNASKVQRLRACFTIAANTLVATGEKAFYLEFLDPQGNIIPNLSALLTQGLKKYSKKTIVLYQGRELPVCDFISVPEGQLDAGMYRIQISYANKVIATTSFELK